MWILFGIMAFIFTLLNINAYLKGKKYNLFMALALGFTAISLCAEYSMVASWVVGKDWSALEDVVPSMKYMLWILTVVSFGINIIPAFSERKTYLKKNNLR